MKMNSTKEILETVVDTQKKAINSFMETANKFQDVFKSGNGFEKTTEIYNDWLKNQMAEFKDITTEAKEESENLFKTSKDKAEEFYKNIYQNQLDAIKKSMEFNWNTGNPFANFGKPANEATESFTAIQNNWTSLFESWTKTLNTTFESLNKTMPNAMNNDLWENAFKTNSLYNKVHEFYKPYMTSAYPNNFSAENLKNMFNPSGYKKITEEMFGTFFQTQNLNTLLENNTKMVQDYIASQQNVSKEFQDFWATFTEKFPNTIPGDFAKFAETFKTTNSTYTDLFAPMMKLVNNTKDKENLELAIDTMDKASLYSTKLAQMQYLLYTTGQTVAQETVKNITDKATESTSVTSFEPFFNEWVALNERTYTDLYGTDEFSKLKAELTTLSLEIKTNIEKQFENKMEHFPIVAKSEMNDLYQTIHDLKKTIKTLEQKMNATAVNGTVVNTATTTATATNKTTTAKKSTTV